MRKDFQKLLHTVLDYLGIDQYTVIVNDDSLADIEFNIIDLTDRDTALLIGRQGENLHALQYIFRTICRSQELSESFVGQIYVDVMDYRRRQIEHLMITAKRMAQEAKITNKEITLRPMNAYERRIVHVALKEDNGVETVSIGEEPNRKIILRPVKETIELE